MTIRFDDIGNRLKAYRMGSGMNAEDIASSIGISRTALYRFEKGELAKIETLEKLSELLEVSVPSLLGVGVEYIATAVSYFERVRQLEAQSERITVLAGPVSYVLTSDTFDEALSSLLEESILYSSEDRERSLEQLSQIMQILSERKKMYHKRRPSMINLISATEMLSFLRNGLVGRHDLPEKIQKERRQRAREETEHFAKLMESEPIGVQIGVVLDTLPHAGFQIFRQQDRKVLSVSPFRLSEQPNIQIGVAMITSALEALELHEKMAEDLWKRSLKGASGAKYLRDLIKQYKD